MPGARPLGGGPGGGVVVHVVHEFAQHLGHLEITRDALLAGLPRAGTAPSTDGSHTTPDPRPSVVNLVIAELQSAGHPTDDI